ncbi:MAG: helix-turn-helix domain-containing protein [Chloroflexota bacterium]|nr:helix-turn-helix domain-containing protein [Chloroflexota bacterium]
MLLDLDHAACCRIFATRDARFDGRIYIGVRTTGIYCRPICPARTPKPEHVSFYPSAAAARHAGFRPCLRCRPELAPEVAAWHGTSTTVVRALGLIEAGALDDGNLASLATHLGISDRQLRRLFQQHLGASPIAVAQTRRVHLAKQLIHETDLSMTDVAFAAGFGSVRRFNETFHQLFQRPPASLRRVGRSTTASAEAVTIRLPYQPPYDWDGMLAYFRPRTIPGVESVIDGRYARSITLDGHAGTLAVEAGAKHSLRVTVRFPRLAALPRIIGRVRQVFDLAANPALIGAHLAEDPLLAPLVAARPGLRVPGTWDNFELAVRAILGQQITVAGATRLSGIIVANVGTLFDDPHAHALGLSHQFPTPAQLAGADVAGLGLMPGARARALTSLAEAVAADHPGAAPALFGPYRDLASTIAHLRSLPGIGEWTAQYIALRALRETDAFPAADVGLLRAMEGEFGHRPSPAALLVRAESWRPWRAYAALHLWASLPVALAAIRQERPDAQRAA